MATRDNYVEEIFFEEIQLVAKEAELSKKLH